MMKKYIAILFTALALTTSCDDWLDVRGENIQKEKNQFESYQGNGKYRRIRSASDDDQY